jgi:hypothetical protein
MVQIIQYLHINISLSLGFVANAVESFEIS